MISVLVLGFDPSATLAAAPGDVVRTLASLVPATVEGLVRDLCLAGPSGSRGLAEVADHAGCGLVDGDGFAAAVRGGAQQLRCPHILVVQPGATFGRPLIDELSSLLPTLTADASLHLIRLERRDLVGRLFPALARPAALLAPHAWLRSTEAARFDALVRSAKPRRTLRAVAWPSA